MKKLKVGKRPSKKKKELEEDIESVDTNGFNESRNELRKAAEANGTESIETNKGSLFIKRISLLRRTKDPGIYREVELKVEVLSLITKKLPGQFLPRPSEDQGFFSEESDHFVNAYPVHRVINKRDLSLLDSEKFERHENDKEK